MDYKYLMKVAIDFGSTNTVMAWRIYETQPDGKLVLSETLNALNYIHRIPSMMILKEENSGNERVNQNLYGEQAIRVANDGNIPPIICDNFKQYLYTAAPDTEEYRKGVDLTTRFFQFLREEYKQIYNRFPLSVTKELKVTLYLSTPVRAYPTHRSLMRKIAQDAGFTPENGVTEICTDYDEAQCVVRYAMDQHRDAMRNVLAKAGQPSGALLLFVDVGGSTMDMSLEYLRIGADGSETMTPIASWPNGDVTYPLGGSLVDEAIRDYLIEKGFAVQEYTMDHWEHNDGKFRFRIFKEDNNQRLANKELVDKLGGLGTVCYDYVEGICPDRNYLKAPAAEKLSDEVYEKIVCKKYIDHMHDALAEVFKKQMPIEGRPSVKPADVDAIFLAGDGSRLYFIRKVLLGQTGDRDPGFEQIMADPNLLFDQWEEPSQCCALGALVEQENVVYPSYAKEKYYLRVRVFESVPSLESVFRKDPNLLSPEQVSYTNAKGESFVCHFMGESQIMVADQYQMLPLKVESMKNIDYTDHDLNLVIFQICLLRVGSAGELQMMHTPSLHFGTRKLGDQLKFIGRVIVGVPTTLIGGGIDMVNQAIGIESHIGDKIADTFLPDRKSKVSIGITADMSENSTVTVTVKLESELLKMDTIQFTEAL